MKGADIHAMAKGDLTPFNYVAMQVHETVMWLLLENGALADGVGFYGTTALNDAAC
jgi:hypothetical protein